jgi:hypothetical protein
MVDQLFHIRVISPHTVLHSADHIPQGLVLGFQVLNIVQDLVLRGNVLYRSFLFGFREIGLPRGFWTVEVLFHVAVDEILGVGLCYIPPDDLHHRVVIHIRLLPRIHCINSGRDITLHGSQWGTERCALCPVPVRITEIPTAGVVHSPHLSEGHTARRST